MSRKLVQMPNLTNMGPQGSTTIVGIQYLPTQLQGLQHTPRCPVVLIEIKTICVLHSLFQYFSIFSIPTNFELFYITRYCSAIKTFLSINNHTLYIEEYFCNCYNALIYQQDDDEDEMRDIHVGTIPYFLYLASLSDLISRALLKDVLQFIDLEIACKIFLLFMILK